MGHREQSDDFRTVTPLRKMRRIAASVSARALPFRSEVDAGYQSGLDNGQTVNESERTLTRPVAFASPSSKVACVALVSARAPGDSISAKLSPLRSPEATQRRPS